MTRSRQSKKTQPTKQQYKKTKRSTVENTVDDAKQESEKVENTTTQPNIAQTETKKRRTKKCTAVGFDNRTKSQKEKDAEDGHEYVFVLEKTNQQFVPPFKSLDEVVDSDKKMALQCLWTSFCRCARSKICEDMEWDNINSVHHKTLGNLPASVFYLFLHDQPGAKFYNWSQRRKWNGMIIKEHCIQFRFKENHPILHTHDDWAKFEITSTQDTGDEEIGVIRRQKKFNLEYISLTCNTKTNEVYSSFKFSKKMVASCNIKTITL